MVDCIFCKILKGEIPCTKVAEDEHFIAFLDIAPINKGHTLVVPKSHSVDLLDTGETVLCGLMSFTKKIAKAIVDTVEADGFNIGINNRKAAGQAVPHLHLHIIPRFEGDGFKHWPQGKYEEGEAEKIAENIAKSL